MVDRIRSLQRFGEEETQRRRVQSDGADAEFRLLQLMHLIAADVLSAELVRAMEVPGEILHNSEIGWLRLSGKVATGSQEPPVTLMLSGQNASEPRHAQRLPRGQLGSNGFLFSFARPIR